ncbi:hypothetical protein M409DRAFT_30841 [Zasmidium cellare ATCC 36951]|uniref:Uncharacterized protein n=1 Tax=Zasmidium cellare ATCC 36951 TaxID=1080233 RepID=A0A6A6BXB4_ZASCE|nr:uncharacterized protein M409DRAFT_30841 [Zasmidium cellare ATCC 36951]KAF2158678.1 hypothetical protein M409DRAFT_30841 [Zasmidium cellare ATCC 36951]
MDRNVKSLKELIALHGEIYGHDVLPVLTFMEQSPSPATGPPIVNAPSVTQAPPVPVATATASNAVVVTASVPPDTNSESAVSEDTESDFAVPDDISSVGSRSDSFYFGHETSDAASDTSSSPTIIGDSASVHSPTDESSETEAHQRAMRHIEMAKRVGNRVRLYKHLESLVTSWIERQASEVMQPEELERSRSVRGLYRRINRIFDPRLRPIRIPQIIIQIWADVLQLRFDVAEEYIREQMLHPSPELEAANGRHDYFRETSLWGLGKLNQY